MQTVLDFDGCIKASKATKKSKLVCEEALNMNPQLQYDGSNFGNIDIVSIEHEKKPKKKFPTATTTEVNVNAYFEGLKNFLKRHVSDTLDFEKT